MKVAILGFGREGQSLLKFFRRFGRNPDPSKASGLQNRRRSPTDTRTHADKKEEIWVLDENKNLKLPRGVYAHLGAHYLNHLAEFDSIFRSPGIPYLLPHLQAARKRGVEISSATKLFFEELSRRFPRHSLLATRCSPTLIGITGTKGKGTTATLLYKMLKAAGKNAYLAGNIGTPALDLLSTTYHLPPTSCVVLELSSFQLQDLDHSPHIAVVLDVFPDHQDSHKTLAEYYAAKANIARHQKKSDSIFFLARNALSRTIARQSPGKKIGVDEKSFRLFDPGDVRLVGAHNFKNAVMAATIAKSLGVPRKTIRRVVRTFRGNEHRLEFVRTIRGISFYNDSASTIPQPTAAAIQSFPDKRIVLIAGGRQKVKDYSSLVRALQKCPPEYAVLIGENKNILARLMRNTKTPYAFAKTLGEAIRLAYRAAKSLRTKPYTLNPVVLFSPGAASFDMFKNYAERGKQFKKIAKGLR